jgi:hypothetical protein
MSPEWAFNDRVARPIACSFISSVFTGTRRHREGSAGIKELGLAGLATDRSEIAWVLASPAPVGKAAFVMPDVKHVTSVRRLWRYPGCGWATPA